MKRPVVPLLLGLFVALTSDAQSTNEIFKMRGTIVSTSRLDGLTFANPHRHVSIDSPRLSLIVRVESIVPPLTNYVKGSLVTFSSSGQSNLFPGDAVRGSTYDFVMSREAGGSGSEPFKLKAPPKPVSPENGSQPIRSQTNTTPSLYVTKRPNLVGISDAVRIASGLRVGMHAEDVQKYMHQHGMIQTNIYSLSVDRGRTVRCPYPLAGSATLMLDMHCTNEPATGLFGWSAPILDRASIQSQGTDVSIVFTNAP